MITRCCDCIYFEPRKEYPMDTHKGYCRRFPPIRDEWAVVTMHDGCGEFSIKAERAHKKDNIHDAMGGREIKNSWYRVVDDGGIAM